jgi:serine/threonine-protein kinase RsbT
VNGESRIEIAHETDIVTARHTGREMAACSGFSRTEQTLIATAISEVARNIVVYAVRGEIVIAPVEHGGRTGLQIIARDRGPGIADVELAMRDGYSTAKSLGFGLPGAKRLMDDFEVASELGRGTTITMRKWRR